MPNGSAEEWEAGWRHSVDTRLTSFDVKLDTLAESMSILKQVVGDMRDATKTAPRLAQGWLELLLMLAFGLVTALCSGSGLILALVNLLAAHWH